MKALIEVTWKEYDESSEEDRLHDIQDGISVGVIEDRYSVDDTAKACDIAWRWINEMYVIPSPASVKDFELKIKFKK